MGKQRIRRRSAAEWAVYHGNIPHSHASQAIGLELGYTPWIDIGISGPTLRQREDNVTTPLTVCIKYCPSFVAYKLILLIHYFIIK